MDTTPFDLTPEQKGMLASLSRETGKPIPTLIAEALKELQEHERAGQTNGEQQAGNASPAAARPHEAHQLFAESEGARSAFGVEVVEHYLNMARVEIEAFEAAVTDWERYRNFERL